MIVGFSIPALAAAQERDEASPQEVVLKVVSNIGGDDALALQAQVRGHVTSQLSDLAIVAAPIGEVQLTVVVDWRDEARTTYAIAVALTHDGEPIAEDQRSCKLCSSAQLFEAVEASVAEVAVSMPEVAALPQPKHKPVSAERRTQVDESDKPRALTGLGWGGVGVVGVGVGVIIGGAVLWAKGKTTRLSPQGAAWLEVRNYRPPGIAMVATGTAILVAGAVMISVNVRRNRRARGVVFVPQGGQYSVGVAAVGRF
ncbi:MAG: hypothetical protein JKY37_03660 [Nannocystaceae bacterium]|nr:hypothetical protein [Nannocystaceae bacterium]